MTDKGDRGEKATKITRSIEMLERVWGALDADARRCRRSAVKQIEAILSVYYGLDDVELGNVAAVRDTVSPYMARGSLRAVEPGEGRAMDETAREAERKAPRGKARSRSSGG